MMNLPFKLRERVGFCTPEGPTINQAELIQFALDDSVVALRAPRHRSSFPARKARKPQHKNVLAIENFESYAEDSVVDDSWKHFPIFFRSWGYYGPWFTGAQAELSLYIDVLTPAAPKTGVSFFHPRAFEASIGSYISNQYSKDRDNGKPLWVAPMNWSVLTALPCVAACLDVNPIRETHYIGIATKHLFFPVGDTYLAHFVFRPHLFANGFMEEREKEVDPTPVNQLLNDIIASLKVTLSPEAQAQQARALEGLSDTSLTPTFPPLKWSDDDADAQSAKYRQLQNKNSL